jgi:hypothetical protein
MLILGEIPDCPTTAHHLDANTCNETESSHFWQTHHALNYKEIFAQT